MSNDKLREALELIDEIVLAGMSGSGQESQEGMRDFHANQAWKFISIAALAKGKLSEALAQPAVAQPECEIEQLIHERDHRDEIIDRLCDAVLGGDRPEWSSAYGFEEAVADVEERVTQLHQPSIDKAWTRFEKAAQPAAGVEGAKLWLWRNFVDGNPEYWAFDNPYPKNLDNADPQTLGEPCGYAIFKPSRSGRTDWTHESVVQAIRRALAKQAAQPEPQGERAEPSPQQMKQLLDGLGRCHAPASRYDFLRTWIRDWTAHKLQAALLSAAPAVREPMTDQQKFEMFSKLPDGCLKWTNLDFYCQGAEDAESHHHIGKPEPVGINGGASV